MPPIPLPASLQWTEEGSPKSRMAAVRPVLPTDLAALVGSGRVYPNEAVTFDRTGTDSSHQPLEAAFEQWLSFATGKHTWISVRGATLRGLVSARRRGSRAAWEIDCLIDAAEEDSAVLMSLLDRLAADAGDEGAEKVFLRVSAESEVIATATRCGFVPYTTELVFERPKSPDLNDFAQNTHLLALSLGLRRWARSDAYDTYRLFNRWTPEPLRRVEAATFGEWQAAREKIGHRSRQWALDREGSLAGWLRASAAGDIGRFELMADPSHPELTDALLEAALMRLREQPHLCCRTHAFATDLHQRLEDRGFAAAHEYALLAKPIARKVGVPQLVPVVPA